MHIYLPIAEMPVNVLLILSMGMAVGFISGLFGVGGGFLITPMLIFLGIPPAIAVGTQAAQIAASGMTSTLGGFRRKAVDVKLGLVLISGGLMGTASGVWFFAALRKVGQLELVILLSYIVLFTFVGSLMLTDSIRDFWQVRRGRARVKRKGGAHPAYLFLPFRMRFPRSKLYGSVIPLITLAFFIGFASAVLGIGGGFILVPALLYLFRIPTFIVIGTTQFYILFTMVFATLMHSVTNNSVDIVLGLMMIFGGVFGTQFGSLAARYLRPELFRFLLALLLLGVGLRFVAELVLRPQDPFSLSVVEPR